MRSLAEGAVTLKAGSTATEAQRNAQRKAASQARAEQWPNTLEATRKRKDQARKDAIAAHEARLVAEDEASMALREEQRKEAIVKAQELVKQQTDKYKILSNYRMRSYDMDVLKKQAELKATLTSARAREDDQYQQRMIDELNRATEEEAKKLEAQRAKAQRMQEERKAQISAIIERRMRELRETEAEGRAMLERIERDNQQAYAAAVARRDEGARKALEFASENKRLNEMRAELKRSEAEMAKWIAEQAASKDAKDAKIRTIIERTRKEAEEKAKVISDIVSSSSSGMLLLMLLSCCVLRAA
jgi:hypothetical protein